MLVEGNVERLLYPDHDRSGRQVSSFGEHLHSGGERGLRARFKSLIEFLGITTLIVTDIDSVIVL